MDVEQRLENVLAALRANDAVAAARWLEGPLTGPATARARTLWDQCMAVMPKVMEAWVHPSDVSAFRPVLERKDGNLLLYLRIGGVPEVDVTLSGTSASVRSHNPSSDSFPSEVSAIMSASRRPVFFAICLAA